MQRLIDADALITAIVKKAFDDAFLSGNTEMHRLLTQVVAHQQTIEAVPVEFIKSEIKNNKGFYNSSLRRLLDAWEKRNG